MSHQDGKQLATSSNKREHIKSDPGQKGPSAVCTICLDAIIDAIDEHHSQDRHL